MNGAYQSARLNPTEIALGLLETQGITDPTDRQFVFARAVGEFLVRANFTLAGGK